MRSYLADSFLKSNLQSLCQASLTMQPFCGNYNIFVAFWSSWCILVTPALLQQQAADVVVVVACCQVDTEAIDWRSS